jgi:hypothetical protein
MSGGIDVGGMGTGMGMWGYSARWTWSSIACGGA